MKIEHCSFVSPYGAPSNVSIFVDTKKEFTSLRELADYVRGLFCYPVQSSASVFTDNGRYLLVTRDAFTCVYRELFPDRGCPTK